MHIHFCSVLPLYPLTMCSGTVIFLSTLIVLSPSYLISLPQTLEKESWFFIFFSSQIENVTEIRKEAIAIFSLPLQVGVKMTQSKQPDIL